jgi:hypothetical protein
MIVIAEDCGVKKINAEHDVADWAQGVTKRKR